MLFSDFDMIFERGLNTFVYEERGGVGGYNCFLEVPPSSKFRRAQGAHIFFEVSSCPSSEFLSASDVAQHLRVMRNFFILSGNPAARVRFANAA